MRTRAYIDGEDVEVWVFQELTKSNIFSYLDRQEKINLKEFMREFDIATEEYAQMLVDGYKNSKK